MSMLTLDEALEQTREVSSWAELRAYLNDRFDFWAPIEHIKSEAWGEEVDVRCGWQTWLVTIDGRAALFTDGDPMTLPP